MSELEDEDKISIFGKSNPDKFSILNSIKLMRVDLYFDEDPCCNYDYGLPEQYTQYVLSVEVDRNDEVVEISMES